MDRHTAGLKFTRGISYTTFEKSSCPFAPDGRLLRFCSETSPGSGEATLILNNQQITSIAPGAFAGLSGLTGLYLFSNQISSQKTNKKNIAGGYDRRGSRALGTRQPVAASTATARISCN